MIIISQLCTSGPLLANEVVMIDYAQKLALYSGYHGKLDKNDSLTVPYKSKALYWIFFFFSRPKHSSSCRVEMKQQVTVMSQEQEQRMWQPLFWNHSPRTHLLKSISWLIRKQRSGIGAAFIMNVRGKNFMAMRLTFLLLASIYVVGGTSSASDSKWGFVSFKIVKR